MDTLYGRNFITKVKSINPSGIREASGGSELLLRCPFCGDSKNMRHAHFYISVPKNHEEISMYHCKKCPAHGITDIELLRRIGCDDSSIMIELEQHNSAVMKLPRYKTLKNIDIFPLKNDSVRQDKNNEYKLRYINNRIGSDFKIEDLMNLKVFLNLYDVINRNRLQITRDKIIADCLDNYFIGFISYDNSYCGMRKIVDKELYQNINKRYVNYNLVNKMDNKKNFYIIPSRVDVFNPSPVKIHIAEGQFDILSIFYNLCGCNTEQSIYIACGGKRYTHALEFILQETGIINFEVHFYPDRDVDDYELDKDFLSKLDLFSADIFVHRNMQDNQKDYGVPMDKIKDTVMRIPMVDI